MIMRNLLGLGLLIGLDNFRFGIGLGTLELGNKRRWLLALSFGLFEMTMPLIGMLIGQFVAGAFGEFFDWAGPILFFGCGVLVLWGMWRSKDMQSWLSRTSWLFILPLLLSIDNLFAGGVIATTDYPLILAALILGLLSATLSFVGLFLGDIIVRYVPIRREVISGSTFLLVSLVSIFFIF